MGCGGSKKEAVAPKQITSSDHTPESQQSKPVTYPAVSQPSTHSDPPHVETSASPQRQESAHPKLADYSPTANYTVLVWAKQEDSLDPFAVPTIHRNDGTRQVTITPITVTSLDTAKIPRVIDAVLYVLKHKSEVPSAKDIYAQYKHVWLHMVQSTATGHEIDVFISETGAQILAPGEEYADKVLAADRDLHILLKTVFEKMDGDKSGFIDGRELVQAAREMKQEVSPQEVESALGEMDANKDSKVSFQEFRDWWKRGRQGAVSIHKTVGSWVERSSSLVPGSIRELNSLLHKRERLYQGSQSQIRLSFGGSFPTKMRFSLDFGSGKVRESFTIPLANTLNYTTKPTWFALFFPCKTATPDSKLTQVMDNFWHTGYEMVMNMCTDSAKIRSITGVNVNCVGNAIVLSSWLDTDDQYCEEFCSAFDQFTSLLDIPLDQSFHYDLTLGSSIEDLQSHPSDSFISTLLSRFQLQLKWTIWSKMVEIFVNSERRKRFASSEMGLMWLNLFEAVNVELEFEGLPGGVVGGGMTNGGFFGKFQRDVLVPLSFMPFYLETINQLLGNWIGEVEMRGKFLNVGFKVTFLCPDLKKLFESSSKSLPKKKQVSKY